MSIGKNIGIPICVVNRHSDANIGKNDVMSIGERVRQARTAKKMTQQQLASKAGISQPTLSELENGDSATTGYIASIAAALDVSALWLETGRGSQHPATKDAANESELDQIIQLIELFRESTPAGRAFILDSASVAEKRSNSTVTSSAINDKP